MRKKVVSRKNIGVLVIILMIITGSYSVGLADGPGYISFDNFTSITQANLGVGGALPIGNVSLDSTDYRGATGKSIKEAGRTQMFNRLKFFDAFNGLDTTTVGTQYIITLWAKVNSASVQKSGYFHLSVIETADLPENLYNDKTNYKFLINDQGWTQLKLPYTIKAGVPVLGVTIEQVSTGTQTVVVDAINMDDLSVTKNLQSINFDNYATISEANLGVGGGLSIGKLSLDSTVYHGNSGKSIKEAQRTQMYNRLKFFDAFAGLDTTTAGTQYNVTLWAKVNSASVQKSGYFYLSVIETVNDTEHLYKDVTNYKFLINDQGWTQLKLPYAIKDGVPVLGVAIEQMNSGTQTVVVDTINMDDLLVEPATKNIIINRESTYQEVWGFGAAANNPVDYLMNTAQAATKMQVLDKLFKTDGNNLGLSIVRLEVNPFYKTDSNPTNALQATHEPSLNVWDWDVDAHQRWFSSQAKSRGCTQFYAVPWSPVGWMKDNNSAVNGGHLLSTQRTNFAVYLREWVKYYRNTLGLDIKWLSIQNEPELPVSYASCVYNYAELSDTIIAVKDEFVTAGLPTKIGGPENTCQITTSQYMDAMSAAAKSKLDFIAYHDYGTKIVGLAKYGKPVMMTETCYTTTNDPSIMDGIEWAKKIYDTFQNRNENAWLYWWAVTVPNNNTGAALINMTGSSSYYVNKRAYVLGQFSRFVKPGYRRVASIKDAAGLYVVAFKNPADNKVVTVVVNDNDYDTLSSVSGIQTSTVSVYNTSALNDLTQLSDVTASGGTFDYTFPTKSVTTFVEQ